MLQVGPCALYSWDPGPPDSTVRSKKLRRFNQDFFSRLCSLYRHGDVKLFRIYPGEPSEASASSSSAPTSSTTRTATAQATESSRNVRAPLRVVLVQVSIFRRLLSRLSGERWTTFFPKNTFPTTSPSRAQDHEHIFRERGTDFNVDWRARPMT